MKLLLAVNGVSFISGISSSWLDVLVATIIAVFGGGGIAAIIRTRKESPRILVDAAQGAVVVQSSVIATLKRELEDQREQFERESAELRSEISELRTHLAELNSLRTRVRDLEQQNEVLQAENTMLQSQVRALSKMVHDQERKNGNG